MVHLGRHLPMEKSLHITRKLARATIRQLPTCLGDHRANIGSGNRRRGLHVIKATFNSRVVVFDSADQ
jgi:hypothetical protein